MDGWSTHEQERHAAHAAAPSRRIVMRAVRAGCALSLLALAACAPLPNVPPPRPAVSAAPGQEPAFMSRIAADDLYEIEVSRLAAQRASNPRVRSLAQSLAAHRLAARRQLAALMRSRGVPVAARLTADKAGKLQRLQALPPSAQFDAAYVRVVGLEDDEQGIALLERARRETRDAALAAWIDRTLPVLRRDLQASRQVAGALAG
jgi:putative membrane protein